MKAIPFYLFIALIMVGCAGIERNCDNSLSQSLGADWVVVELTETDAVPYRCWELHGVSIGSEEGSDGIFWRNENGNMIHVAGSYDYVQVDDDNWTAAFREVNLTQEICREIRNRIFNPQTNRYE